MVSVFIIPEYIPDYAGIFCSEVTAESSADILKVIVYQLEKNLTQSFIMQRELNEATLMVEVVS